MILTISDSEEGILNKIKSVLACESTLEVMEITNSEKLTFQGLEIDQLQRSVIKDGKVVELTRHEYDLLFSLLQIFESNQQKHLEWLATYLKMT